MSNENFEEALEKEKQAIDFGRINYIHQHRTFIRLARYMKLTTQERSLYEMLLEIDNSSGWKDETIDLVSPILEQDADIVMFLYRESYYDTTADDSRTEVIVLKNRNGKTGTARLLFDRECSRFTDMPEIIVPKRRKHKDLTAPPISA